MVYVSTGAFSASSLAEILSLCEQCNIAGLELSSGLRYDAEIESLVRRAASSGPILIHNYFPAPQTPFVLNLAARNTEIQTKSLRLCQRAIDLCAAFEIPFYSVHSGFRLEMPDAILGNPEAQKAMAAASVLAHDVAYDVFAGNVHHLCTYAAARGVRLLLENNVVTDKNLDKHGDPHFLMSYPEEMIRFLKDINDENLGVLLDTGHLYVTAKTMGFDCGDALQQLGQSIEAFHLSVNDGTADTNEKVDEDAWFLPYLQQFPQATIVLEAYRLSVKEITRQRKLISMHLSGEYHATAQDTA